MMTLWFLYLLVAVAVEANDVCVNYESKYPGLYLECKKDHIIYKPDVVAHNNDSCENDGCFGQTPDLIVQKNKCQQEKCCTISTPKYFIISPINFSKCGLMRPRALSFNGGFCMKKSAVHDICDKENNFKNISSDEFIIRSHPDYPWNYNQQTFNPSGHINIQNKCILRFAPKDTHTKVFIQVNDIDISDDTDYISIKRESTSFNITTYDNGKSWNFSLQGLSDRNIYFNFWNILPESTDSRTQGGKGFIICVKATAGGNSVKSACENLISANLRAEPTKEVTGPGAKCKRRKKNKRKKKCKPKKKCRNKNKGKKNRRRRKGGKKKKGRKKTGKKGIKG